jgi:NAD(P)-dependent dehydrogenase (short-subunit alcohol dehydrogenase family)
MKTGLTVITGAGGFGRAAAIEFGKDGPILLGSHSQSSVDSILDTLQSLNIEAYGKQVDIDEPESVKAFAEYAASLEPIQNVVNIAGVATDSPPHGISSVSERDILRINALGTMYVVDAFRLIMQDGGTMILVGSTGAYMVPNSDSFYSSVYETCYEAGFMDRLVGAVDHAVEAMLPNASASDKMNARKYVPYQISKSFVLWYTSANVGRFAKRKQRILSVSPGPYLTRQITEDLPEEGRRHVLLGQPLGFLGKVMQMADVMKFLCSEGAANINGVDILVDGGKIAALQKKQLT